MYDDKGPYYVTALLSLLGSVKRVCAMATKAGETRTVPSGPSKGQVLPVDVDTHINAILEFVCGAQVTLTCSFDVWDSGAAAHGDLRYRGHGAH